MTEYLICFHFCSFYPKSPLKFCMYNALQVSFLVIFCQKKSIKRYHHHHDKHDFDEMSIVIWNNNCILYERHVSMHVKHAEKFFKHLHFYFTTKLFFYLNKHLRTILQCHKKTRSTLRLARPCKCLQTLYSFIPASHNDNIHYYCRYFSIGLIFRLIYKLADIQNKCI